MKQRRTNALIILIIHALFAFGLSELYGWWQGRLFNLPIRVGLLYLPNLFILLFAIIVILIALLALTKRMAWLGLKKPDPAGWRDTFVLLAFIWPIPLLGRLLDPSFDKWYADQLGLLEWAWLASFLISLILVVAKEELFERLMQRILLDAYGPALSILAISVNFGWLHFYSNPLIHGLSSAISVALVSLILCLVYARTKNLWLSLAFHLAFNLIIVGQILLHASGDAVGEILLWVVWGGAWLILLKPGARLVRSAMVGSSFRLKAADWAFLLLFAFILPAAYLILMN